MIALYTSKMCMMFAYDFEGITQKHKIFRYCSDEDIVKLEIPTGAPIHYIFDKDGNVIKKQNLID